jgi:hypothetical protein
MGIEIKKPNKRIVVAGILLLSLVVDLVFIIVLLPKILKKTQEMQEYHINEDVPVMYDGLIKYVDDEAKLLSIREDENGQLYGLRWNPDERINLSNSDLTKLHKVAVINL